MSTTTTSPPPPSSPTPTPDENPSSPPPIPTATLALPSTAAAATTRRLPPPCWSPDETLALIQAYRDKWYSLRRGNLRANHWQEVADEIAAKCPVPTPKTAVQCRHKMEKLRKRYRAEIQRAAKLHGGLRRYNSPWAHFNLMHEMEKGPGANNRGSNPPPTPPSSSDDEDEDEHDRKSSVKRINDLYNSSANQVVNNNGIPTGFRIRIPGRVISSPPVGQFDGMNSNPNPYLNNPYPNPNFNMNQQRFGNFGGGSGVNNGGAGSSKISPRDGFLGKKVVGEIPKKRKVANGGGMNEIVSAVQALGEGFMRIEKAKMDMVRHVEEMRMEMELKRTEMILESQQRIVETFAKAVTERKRMKKVSTTMNNSTE